MAVHIASVEYQGLSITLDAIGDVDMNGMKNIRIEVIEGGFVEHFTHDTIEKVVCMYNNNSIGHNFEEYDGKCTVYYLNSAPRELSVYCSVYNAQYFVPISNDGTKLFIGSWYKGLGNKKMGLLAYDIMSGNILWRFAEGRIREIFVYTDYLIALKANSAIFKIDINNAVVLAQIKSKTIEAMFVLEYPFVLVDTIEGTLSLLDVEKMLIVKKYNQKIINPSNCLGLVILDVALQDKTLIITGYEEYPNRNFTIADKKNFRRVIDTDLAIQP